MATPPPRGEGANAIPTGLDFRSVKPDVKENNNGELCMSMEETNRVRAALGLKPLVVDGPSGGNVKDLRAGQEQDRKSSEVQQRLERARKKRKLKEKLEGTLLSEVVEGEETLLSAADWVQRSKERSKLLQRPPTNDRPPPNHYDHADLQGMKVSHAAEDFDAGKTQTLTLKDSSLLETDAYGVVRGLADSSDELENAALSEAQRRRDAKERAARAKLGAYVAFDDDEFQPGETPRGILSHYDEVIRGKGGSGGPRLVLGVGGEAAVPRVVAGDDSSRSSVNADLTQPATYSSTVDYYTEEEMTKFKKPKKRRRKKMRGREAASDDTGTASALEGSITSTGQGRVDLDHGSRAQEAEELAMSVDSSTSGKARFDRAVIKASEMAVQALEAAASGHSAQKLTPYLEELDDDLARRLVQARQSVLGKDSSRGEEDMVRRVAAMKRETQEEKAPHKMVFTSTTEFASRLGAVLSEKARDGELAKQKEVARAERGAAERLEWSERRETAHAEEGEEADEGGGAHAEDASIEYMHRQPLARSSMAAALSLLQQSGDIRASNQESLSGRARDRRNFTREDHLEHEGRQQEGFHVNIDYRDEFGRQLTRKEAFRQLSYKFHGYGPGKKKQEKRLKQLDEEQARHKARDKDLNTVMAQQRVQEATSKPFVMVGGAASAGDASLLHISKSSSSKRKSLG
jgi:U4/U6.U5 tri-snRNP-associated protein 1